MIGLVAAVVQIGLFGDSTVATTYLPEGAKHHEVLEQELRRTYPGQEIKVSNFADNGEFIARYLLRGAYETHRASLSGLDVAIIRFGANDAKRMGTAEYLRHLEKFIALLKTDFPGVQIVLETGMYLDYPAHHSSDRNKDLNPFWQVSRNLAAADGYPLVDYYEAVKTEAAAGNWDVRIRSRAPGTPFVMDSSQDAGKEDDPKWFTDIHPNPEGARIAVREEVRVLMKLFPDALPSGERALAREAHDADFYAESFGFSLDRMNKKPSVAQDQLQEATH